MKMCDTSINPFLNGGKIATKIRREKNENYVEFSFHSISGSVHIWVEIRSRCKDASDFTI